jgi:transcriptional regulator with XRE-family HTH domain
MGRPSLTTQQLAEGRRLALALQAARQARERSQSAIAIATGLSIDTIRALERQRIPAPSFFTVARLARELELDLDVLARDAIGG